MQDGSSLRQRRHGAMLGVVLSIIAFSTILALSFAATSVFGLNCSVLKDHQALAVQVADSAIYQAIDQLTQNYPDYGLHSERLRVDGPYGSHAILTFNPKDVAPEVYLSSNHLADLGSTPGPVNIVIPGASYCLVATGWCGSTVRHSVAIVNFPPFPYALASGGNLTISASSVGSFANPAPGASPTPASPGAFSQNNFGLLLPGSIAANGQMLELDGAGTSVTSVRVTGNGVTRGTALLVPKCQIDGAVEENHDKVPLPHIPIAMPAGADPLPLPGSVGDVIVSGLTESSGSLTVSGNLQLSDGILYVPGDLRVTDTGLLTGFGTVVVLGSTTITGDVNLSTSTDIALLSAGPVTVIGKDESKDFLCGVVYTNSNFTANHVTLNGAFLTDPIDGATVGGPLAGDMTVSSPIMVHNGGATRIITSPETFFGVVDYKNNFYDADPTPQLHQVGYYTATGRLREPGEMVQYGGSSAPDVLAFQVNYVSGNANPVVATFPAVMRNGGGAIVAGGTVTQSYPTPVALIKAMETTNTGFVRQRTTLVKEDMDRWAVGIQILLQNPQLAKIAKFDLNNFLSPADKASILMWKTW